MSEQEILEEEKRQDNSTEIYKVAARVKNLARGGEATLTPAGEALCNVFVHVLKDLYLFSETLDSTKREELYNLLRIHEGMPGKLISLMRPKRNK
jgi:hypothetical protein